VSLAVIGVAAGADFWGDPFAPHGAKIGSETAGNGVRFNEATPNSIFDASPSLMNEPDPLHRLFTAWKHEAPPSVPSVAAEVRRRIRDVDEKSNPRPRLARIEAAFSRPSFATAFVAACVLLGLFLAEVRITHRENEQTARIEQSYLRLIDPLIVDPAPASADASP
jgi:hypothetical protein